jgi:hypothetical protein
MSTLLIATSPGDTLETVMTSGLTTGSGMQTSNSIEVQINQATTTVNDGGNTGSSTRQLTRQEVLEALWRAIQAVEKGNWPYAAS